jgi:hypothetical protein
LALVRLPSAALVQLHLAANGVNQWVYLTKAS